MTDGFTYLTGQVRSIGVVEAEMGDVVGRFLEQHADVVVVEGIEHLAPVPLTHDETQMTKDAQLMRDRRCLHPDRIRQLVH